MQITEVVPPAEEVTPESKTQAGDKHGELVSPNEMFKASKDIMLEGREPETPEDWARLANFWAANSASNLEIPITKLMAQLFNAPLTDVEIVQIAVFQIAKREEANASKQTL